MSPDKPKILAFSKAPCRGKPIGGVVWRDAAGLASFGGALEDEWDYIYLGHDCEILDNRLLLLAAEYAARERPDMMVFSSPSWRTPTGRYELARERFHVLCGIAAAGELYVLGNKLFSRRLWGKLSAPLVSPFLTEAFRNVKSIVALSHPWVRVVHSEQPSDKDFFAFVEWHADAGREGAHD